MKNRAKPLLITLTALIIAAATARAGSYYVVKTCDYLGNAEYKVMTQEDYTAFVKQIKNENMQWSNAHKLSEKEWKATPRPCRYPGRSLHHRQARIYKRFRSMEEAEAAVMKKMDQINAAAEKKQKREEQRELMKNRSSRHNSRGSSGNRSKQRREERDAKHKSLMEQACSIFAKNLNELVAKQARLAEEHKAKMRNEMGYKSSSSSADSGNTPDAGDKEKAKD